MLYFARCLSALCLFAFLAKANTWMDATSNLVLVTGYRLLLIASPLVIALMGRHAAAGAFIVGAGGCILWLKGYVLLAAFSIALGLSVGGFLIKTQAACTPNGAAMNKIALNIGCLIAGGCVAMLPDSRPTFLLGGSAILLICVLTCLKSDSADGSLSIPIDYRSGAAPAMAQAAWALIGIAIGIKLVGVFTVLPQYLLHLSGHTTLPVWYGWMLSLNSLFVIVLQLPIMRLMGSRGVGGSLVPLVCGMAVLATPNLFFTSTLIGAVAWTFALSSIECAASYLDTLAARDGALLAKDSCVGVGAGLTVLATRLIPGMLGAYAVVSIGVICIGAGYLLVRSKLGANNQSSSLEQWKEPKKNRSDS